MDFLDQPASSGDPDFDASGAVDPTNTQIMWWAAQHLDLNEAQEFTDQVWEWWYDYHNPENPNVTCRQVLESALEEWKG